MIKTVLTVTHLRGLTLRQAVFSAEMPVLAKESAWYTTSFLCFHGKRARIGFYSALPTRFLFFPLVLKKALGLQDTDPPVSKDLRSTVPSPPQIQHSFLTSRDLPVKLTVMN